MTQENKELLLKDLCARLPYKVKIVRYVERNNKIDELIPKLNLSIRLVELFIGNDGFIIKPYLRPMSSMTEEEKKEYSAFGFEVIDHINANRDECPKYQVIEVSNFSRITKITDWLNKHHFDYRGLIPKGLALEAPKDMYKINYL